MIKSIGFRIIKFNMYQIPGMIFSSKPFLALGIMRIKPLNQVRGTTHICYIMINAFKI